MKKIYEDAELTVTKFEYEKVMSDIDEIPGEIPDTSGGEGEGGWQ